MRVEVDEDSAVRVVGGPEPTDKTIGGDHQGRRYDEDDGIADLESACCGVF
jgi:hypothetical protein